MDTYTNSAASRNRKQQDRVSGRDILSVHWAAELFPMMSEAELIALGEDIVKNGLKSPIVLWRPSPKMPAHVLDGRNRLVGIELAIGHPVALQPGRARKWVIEAGEWSSDLVTEIDTCAPNEELEAENARLRRENHALRREIDLLQNNPAARIRSSSAS
jgi:hypothetical protein